MRALAECQRRRPARVGVSTQLGPPLAVSALRVLGDGARPRSRQCGEIHRIHRRVRGRRRCDREGKATGQPDRHERAEGDGEDESRRRLRGRRTRTAAGVAGVPAGLSAAWRRPGPTGRDARTSAAAGGPAHARAPPRRAVAAPPPGRPGASRRAARRSRRRASCGPPPGDDAPRLGLAGRAQAPHRVVEPRTGRPGRDAERLGDLDDRQDPGSSAGPGSPGVRASGAGSPARARRVPRPPVTAIARRLDVDRADPRRPPALALASR